MCAQQCCLSLCYSALWEGPDSAADLTWATAWLSDPPTELLLRVASGTVLSDSGLVPALPNE